MTVTDDEDRPPSFTDQAARVRVTARSPDGSVKAHLDRSRGVTVELTAEAVGEHTEESLARQISAALRGAAAGGDQGLTRIHELRWGSPPRGPETGPRAEYLRRLQQGLSEIEVRALAPRGYVQVGYRGTGGFDVRIEPGTLRRGGVDHEQLASEVSTALERVLRDWTTKWMRLRAEISALP